MKSSSRELSAKQKMRMDAVGSLAGGLAHELNNALACIIGHAELVMDDIPPGKPARNDIERILREGYRIKDLTRQLFVYSRMSHGRHEPVDIVSLAKQLIQEFKAALPARIVIKEDIDEREYLVSADADQLRQAVMHLITNAVYAMRERGGELRIAVTGAGSDSESGTDTGDGNTGPFVKIRIGDTGHGIDPQVLERVFDPYFTTKPVGKGKGLGLALAYGIVSRYGGVVAVCSTPGNGTTFDILLPLLDNGC